MAYSIYNEDALEAETRQAMKEPAKDASADDLYKLGLAYASGMGLDIDYVQAHKWFNIAASMGNEEAKFGREDIANLMSRREVANAQQAARLWMKTLH